eukprot:scaffold35411_cov56-Attheya_sp.AAC.7
MIRSSRIPPVLSRICGGGIHAALLITMDGELLGSYQDPEHEGFPEKNMSDVGALVSEVASDYRQMGVDLSLLAPTAKPASTNRRTSTTPQPGEDLVDANALSGESITSSRGLLNCLILELDMVRLLPSKNLSFSLLRLFLYC